MTEPRPLIESRLCELGVGVTPDQVTLLARYLELLERWNSRMNLTSLDSHLDALERLIVEPVLAAAFIDQTAIHLVDLGSGGGSPAIPLRIMRADLRLTMVEVRTKKSVFLREAIRELGLERAAAVTGTFEDVLSSGRLGTVDAVSVRAVRMEDEHLRLVSDVLAPGGQMLWFLGSDQSLPASPYLGAAETHPLIDGPVKSRLAVLRKRRSSEDVPRGTIGEGHQ